MTCTVTINKLVSKRIYKHGPITTIQDDRYFKLFYSESYFIKFYGIGKNSYSQ